MPEMILKDSEFQKFSRYVQEASGINLHDGKRELLKARLGKIIRQRKFKSFREYYEHVVQDESGNELTTLLDSVSTNLTYFFREPKHFALMRKVVLPEAMKSPESQKNKVLRVWSAGCSSGEEAYSIAMTVREASGNGGGWRGKILATDLSTKVLATAAAGVYPKEKTENITLDLKRKYFQMGENNWKGYFRAKKSIRSDISFERLNFTQDFVFQQPFHVIFCRNVMIYFETDTKEILVEKFYRNLTEGGYLFIGHAESLTGLKHRFKYIQPSVFKKV